MVQLKPPAPLTHLDSQNSLDYILVLVDMLQRLFGSLHLMTDNKYHKFIVHMALPLLVPYTNIEIALR